MKNVVAGTDLYCPGALLNTRVEGSSPLGHGLETETPVLFQSSPVFEAPQEKRGDAVRVRERSCLRLRPG